MTDVIKSDGKKQPFKAEKIINSIEKAVKDAGFNPQEKTGAIDHASRDAIQMAQNMNQVETKEIRNTILNDLEQDEPQIANTWKQYERQHRKMTY